MKKICVFTQYHRCADERIFHKEIQSLKKIYKNSIIYVSLKSDFPIDYNLRRGIEFISINEDTSRSDLWKLLKRINADIYHFHDPQFIFFGLKLSLLGKDIVYDVHEHYYFKLKNKSLKLRILAPFWQAFEVFCSKFFRLIIAADSRVASQFKKSKTIVIGNYPPLNFISLPKSFSENKEKFKVVYVGTIHEQRGLLKAVEALKFANSNIELHIVGSCKFPELEEIFNKTSRVVYHGRVPWEDLPRLLSEFHLGIALYQKIPAFSYYPGDNIVKLFEYCAKGIPYMISDFPGLSSFSKKYGGGIVVDPESPEKIANAWNMLSKNPALYNQLSVQGIELVKNQFNWEAQEDKFLNFYQKIVN